MIRQNLKFLITLKFWNFEELLLAVRDASNSGLSEEAALYPGLTCLQPHLYRCYGEELSFQRDNKPIWQAGSDRYAVAEVRSGQVMDHLPFLGFRWLLKDMASCIHTQRSLALDWIMDMRLEVQWLYFTTVEVKLKFPFGFRSTEPKRYTILTKNSHKTDKHL